MTQVLITGGAGFIGSNLANQLIKNFDEYEVSIFDNLHPQVHHQEGWPAHLPPSASLFKGDVSNKEDWDKFLQSHTPEIIIHLAAETGTGQSLTEATRHGMVNVVGTTEMIDSFTRNNIQPKHIVLASSRAVYGDGVWQSLVDGNVYVGSRPHSMLEKREWNYLDSNGGAMKPLPSKAGTTEPRPTNVYAATKLAQEHILQAWTLAYGIPLSILRFQNVYGPGQSLENSYTGIVALFSRLAYEKQAIQVYEDGAIIRDFVYIDDVVQGIVKSISNPPSSIRMLDIGSGDVCTVEDVANNLAEIGDAPQPVVTGKYRDGDVRAAISDITEAQKTINYSPEWPVKRGLESLYEWVKANRS
ncbi:MAG: NAD(P)-dependent oxidoreductase [Patescibacteria group bacterium]